jgi:hypothetical protein
MEELTARNVFVVILSPDAANSAWVNAEIDLAWQQKLSHTGKQIIPLLYRECSMRADLNTLQFISFLPPNTYESAFSVLLAALNLPVVKPPLPSAPVRPTEPTGPKATNLSYPSPQPSTDSLIILLARAGQWEQAEAMAYAIEDRQQKAKALSELVDELARARLWSRAEAVTRTIEDRWIRSKTIEKFIDDLVKAEEWGRAEALAYTIENDWDKARILKELSLKLANAGQWDRARALARAADILPPYVGAYEQSAPPPAYMPATSLQAAGGVPSQRQPVSAPYPPLPSRVESPRKSQRRVVPLSILLLAILILSGAGFFIIGNNQTASRNTTATATAAAQNTRTAIAATATSTSSANPYPPHNGVLVLNDPLTDNSKGYRWSEASISGVASCGFSKGSYHMVESRTKTFDQCVANATNFDNFAYQAEMTILRGDCGGLVFRADNSRSNFYIFEVCSDGTYGFAINTGNTGKYLITHTTNSAIKTGPNQRNIIAVVVNGTSIQMYVNNKLVDKITDGTFVRGQIGLLVNNFTGPTEVIYNNAKVWKL